MAQPNSLTTVTNQTLAPQVVDTILNSNVGLTRFLMRAKKWKGETMKFPIKYQKGISGTSFSGYDTFSTAASDTRINMSFTPKFFETNVSLPLDQIWTNESAGEAKIIDLAEVEMASRAEDMADSLGDQFYGDGTGNGSKDFTGLAAIVDDGTAVATYGGLTRSTYTTIKATVTASGGPLSLLKMATLYSAITSGSIKPTLGLTTEAIFNLYEQLLQPQERIAKDVPMMKNAKGMQAGTGFTGLFYKGFPILADEKCPSGKLYFLNEDTIDFYAVEAKTGVEPVRIKLTDIKGNDYSSVEGLGFKWSGWIKAQNSAAIVGHFYLGGDFICTNPKRNGVLTGITTV